MGPALPEIRSQSSSLNGVRLALTVPPTLRFFPGHFPGLPILPGVVQLHWAIALAAEYLGAATRVERVCGLKFSRIVQPGEQVTLVLERADRGFAFRFENGAGPCSSGRFICAQ